MRRLFGGSHVRNSSRKSQDGVEWHTSLSDQFLHCVLRILTKSQRPPRVQM